METQRSAVLSRFSNSIKILVAVAIAILIAVVVLPPKKAWAPVQDPVITYHANGGTCSADGYTYDETAGEYPSITASNDSISTTDPDAAIYSDGENYYFKVGKVDSISGTFGDVTASRSDYTFAGWNTAPDGSGTTYQPGSTYTHNILNDSPSIDLYAQWVPEAVNCTVAFQFVGTTPDGVSVPSTQTVSSGATAAQPELASVSGWTFNGWYTDESLTQQYNFATPVNSNITLYGSWAQTPANSDSDNNDSADETGDDTANEEDDSADTMPDTGDNTGAGAGIALLCSAAALAVILKRHSVVSD